MGSFLDNLNDYGSFVVDEWQFIIGICALVAVLVGSGSFSASIAENRRRSPVLHFLVGCVVPIIYPLVAAFTMSTAEGGTRRRAKAKEEEVMHMEGAPPAEAPPVMDGEAGPTAINEDVLGMEVVQFDQGYFKKLSHDDRGNFRGPFQFVVGDHELKVERIIEALDQVVIIENINADGKTQHLRIPYTRIESCVEIV